MLKKAKVAFLLIMALVFALQSVPVAQAAGDVIIQDLTAQSIFDDLGDALNYGTVAREWEQNAHAETSACVDYMDRYTNTIFANTGSTYFHAMNYTLEVGVSAPKDVRGMEFALYKFEDGEYVRCPGTEQTITSSGNSATLTWEIGDELKNTRLYVFQTDGDGYIEDGQQNGQGMTVTNGPSLSSSAHNNNYIGKMIFHSQKGEGDSLGIFNTTDYSPSLTFGPETRAYHKKWNQELQKDEYFVIDPNDKDLVVNDVLINYYYTDQADFDPARDDANLKMGYMKMDGMSFVNGKFVKSGDVIGVTYVEEGGYADKLLDQAEKVSKEWGNLGGGEITSLTPDTTGGSTVTGPVTDDGYVVSLYDMEVGEDGIFQMQKDTGWNGIPVAENEYVIINLICPSKDGKVKMGISASDITYFYKEGQSQGEGVAWGGKDSNSSQRVIFNFVYADENGVMQPYEGTIEPTARHGGTLLAPKAFVELVGEVHNGAIIADKVNNGQEIHQRNLAPLNRKTWIKMDGGYLTLDKVSLEWQANGWGGTFVEGDPLPGAVFGVYSDEACTQLVEEITTDENGVATSGLLAGGDYWVKEIKAPDGYSMPTDRWGNVINPAVNVTVEAGKTARVKGPGYRYGWDTIADGKFVNTQSNTRYGDLRVEKIISDNGKPLQGVTFGIYTRTQGMGPGAQATYNLVGTMTTNRNGVAVYYDLPILTDWYGYAQPYYVKEISAPDGYKISNNNYVEVYLTADGMVTADGNGNAEGNAFANDIIRGNMALKKVDSQTNANLEGAEFTIYSDHNCTEVVGVMTTKKAGDADSKKVIEGKDGLIPGTYYVKETKAPEGYLLPANPAVYTVHVLPDKMVDVVTDKEIARAPEATAIGNDQAINITGTKVWFDEGFENIRPQEIKVELYKDTQYLGEKNVSAQTDWKFAFENLPRYDEDGKEINYIIKENLAGKSYDYYTYINEVDADGNITATVANSIKKTKIVGQKVWEDKIQYEPDRPNDITFFLLQQVGDELVPVKNQYGQQMTATGSSWNGYKFEFRDLPSYDANGDPAVYVVKEAESDKYVLVESTSTSKTEQGNTQVEITLTNRLTVPLSGTKVWQDSSNADGKRPEKVALVVYCNGKRMEPQPAIEWDKETDADVWQWRVSNLPKYDEDNHLNEYTVKEEPVPAGYTGTVSEDGLTFYNTKTGSLRLYKVFVDQDGKNQPLNGAEFKLYWDEACQKPVSDTVYTTALAGPTRNGFIEITDLAPGDYYIREEKAPKGFALPVPNKPIKVTVVAGQIARVNGEHGVVTNAPDGESTTIAVNKTWVGDEGKEDARPASIEVQLYANGTAVSDKKLTLNVGNQWAGSFTDLDKYDADGKEITYTVDEAAVPENYIKTVATEGNTVTITNTYVASVSVPFSAKKTLEGSALTDGQFTFQLLDKDNNVVETKANDGSGNVVFAPITYTLADMKATGDDAEMAEVKANGGYYPSKTFTYTIQEVVPADEDKLPGVIYDSTVYTAEVRVTCNASDGTLSSDVAYKKNGAAHNGDLVFANTSIELVDVSVTKVWNHGTNDKHPVEINVVLVVDGTPDYNRTVRLSKNNAWAHTWTDLPKYGTDEDGKQYEIDYSVKESSVPNDYVSKLSANAKNDYVITNTYVEDNQELELTFPVTKIVKGNETSEEFTFKLEGRPSAPPAPMPTNAVPGSNGYNYVTTKTTGSAAGTTVNFDTIKVTSAKVKYDGWYPPYYVTYGWKVSEVIPENKNPNIIYDEGWYEILVDFCINEDGNLVIADRKIWDEDGENVIRQEPGVTITHNDADGTTAEIPYNNGSFALPFTNTVFAPTEVELFAKKTLDGADYNGKEFSFQLKEGDKTIKTVTEAVNGVVTFDTLRFTLADMKATEADAEKPEVVANGGYYPSKTFTYTISEVAGTDANVIYDSTVYTAKVTVTCDTSTGTLRSEVVYEKNGTPITGDVPVFANATEKMSVSVTKVWNDNNNAADKRPANIQVQLRRGDDLVNTVELPHQGNWSYTWNDLPKYDINGQECVYRVVEITMDDNYLTLPWVEDYVLGEPVETDGGYKITNTYVSAKKEITLTKKLNGQAPGDVEFDFMLTPKTEGDKNQAATVKNSVTGGIVFGLKYGKADMGKTYVYEIAETLKAGYYCDSAVYTVTVAVGANIDADGNLPLTVTYKKGDKEIAEADLVFENASAITAELPVQKTLITNNVSDVVRSYSFTLTPKGATEPEQTISVTVGESQTGNNLVGGNTFKLSFDEPGTYTYTVKEITDTKPGYEYDTTEYEVTYKVDFEDGMLQLAAGYPQISPAATNGLLTFTNTYTQQAGSATLHAKKVFTNGDLSATQFTFELLGEDGKAVLDKEGNAITATSNANGEVTFPDLHYDVVGTYKYVIKEKVPADKGGIVYDEKAVNVTVLVEKVGNELKPTVTYDGGEAVFTNTQLKASGKVHVKKNFADNKTAAGDYTFTMTPVDNAPALANNTLTLTFDGTNTEASGEFQLPTYTAPGTYQYTVKESITTKDVNIDYDSTDYTVVVTVARNGNELVATVSSDDVEITEQLPIVFTNKVLTTSLSGTKVWANDEVADRPVKITIRLLADNKATDKYVELAPTETEWSFTDLPVKDENGKPITYSVAEDAVPGYVTTISGTTITNTKISDGEAVIKAKKTLNNAVPAKGQFTFQLLDKDGKVVDKKTNDASGIVTFDKLTYTEAKDYTYTIVEVMPQGATAENNYAVNGMTYDPTKHTVTVEVKQEGTVLVATVTYNGTSTEPPVFTNTYEAKEAELTLSLSKTLINGAELPVGRSETFTFVLADEEGAMQDEVELSFTKANGEPQTATFEKLTFEAEGTYKYIISEKASEKEDIISDTTKYYLEVKVDDVDGQLVATQTLTKQTGAENATSAEAIVFTNTYEAKVGELILTATKAMSGRPFQTNDSFTFTVAGSDGAPMPANTEVTIKPTSGTTAAVNFGKINFTEVDAGKEYTYTIRETEPAEADKLPGVTYDTTPYEVKVTVANEVGKADLTVTADYPNNEDELVITNTYTANGELLLTGTKAVTGDSTVAEHKNAFTFGVFDASGAEIATGTNDEDGNIAFSKIAYELDQVGTYEYTVKETGTRLDAAVSEKYIVETDKTEYTIQVSVANNTATGNLDVTWSIKEPANATGLEFENKFRLRKGNIGVVKVDSKDTTKGLAGAEFTVYTDAACTTILVLDGEEAIITTGETGAGVLDDLPIGTYWVKETKAPQHYLLDDETVYEVTVVEGDRAMVNEANGAHVTNRKMAKLALEKSDRLNPDKKLRGAKYTLFTEEACENILVLPDGTPAIITTGEDGVGELEGVLAGTYWVKETKAPEGYEVDPEPYKVVVPEEDDPQNPVFVQVSDFPLRGALSLSKTVVASSEVTDTFLFDIELTLETGDPIVGSYKATLNGAETDDVTFAATETGAKTTVELKDGETLTIIGLRSGVSYTVTEQPNSRYDVTVNGAEATAATGTITDNGHSIVKYQNTLKETGFTVEKVWLGEDAGEIKLTLYANGVAMDPQPEVTRDGNTYSYENLVMKDENGEEIVYTVKETAMAGYTTTYQNAAPNADKTDAAYNGGKIINQAMTTFAVKKEWSGLAQGEKAPAIQLTLYCNGKVYTAATPTPDKDGWYTYADLPAYVDGEVAVYTVKEQPVTGFTTTYINKGENAAVTDCAYNGSTIVNSKIPQTGDNAPLTLWMLTTLLAACGLMGVMATLRKREN